MSSNKLKTIMPVSTVLIFILAAGFEVLKSRIFPDRGTLLYELSTAIFVTGCVFVIMAWMKKSITSYYQEINQELRNAQISAEASSQQLQAINQEMKRMQDELRLSNEQQEQQKQDLDILLQAIPEGIIKTDAKGKVLFCNKRLLEETGLKSEELINRDIKNIILLDDQPSFSSEFSRIFVQGMIKEISFRNCKGTLMLADIVAIRDRNGQINGTLGAIREFSKTGKIIDELDNSREELRQKIEEMQLLHRTTIDREKRIIALKEQIETLKRELAKSKGAENK